VTTSAVYFPRGTLFSLGHFDAQLPEKQIDLKECSRTFVSVAIVPSENNFEYLMFSIYYFLLLLFLFLNLKVILPNVSFFTLKKIPAFRKRPKQDVVLIYTGCLQMSFVCVPLLNGTILF